MTYEENCKIDKDHIATPEWLAKTGDNASALASKLGGSLAKGLASMFLSSRYLLMTKYVSI